MNKILILTKNVLAEQQLQKQLQLLNYEVFCSAEAFKNAQMFAILQFFPIILLSETISNLEVNKILEKNNKNMMIRLSYDAESNEKEKEAGIVGYLSRELSFDNMREKLVQLQAVFHEERLENEGPEYPPVQKIENRSLQTSAGRIYFSKKEEKLFVMLLQGEGRMLSRSEICEALWTEGETDSNRSQLSCIATKIKNKFKSIGYKEETIITKWGQGYALAPGFYQYLTTGQLENEYLDYECIEESSPVSV